VTFLVYLVLRPVWFETVAVTEHRGVGGAGRTLAGPPSTPASLVRSGHTTPAPAFGPDPRSGPGRSAGASRDPEGPILLAGDEDNARPRRDGKPGGGRSRERLRGRSRGRGRGRLGAVAAGPAAARQAAISAVRSAGVSADGSRDDGIGGHLGKGGGPQRPSLGDRELTDGDAIPLYLVINPVGVRNDGPGSGNGIGFWRRSHPRMAHPVCRT